VDVGVLSSPQPVALFLLKSLKGGNLKNKQGGFSSNILLGKKPKEKEVMRDEKASGHSTRLL
jgi:hypothetical protein